jgi:hypothetical protein
VDPAAPTGPVRLRAPDRAEARLWAAGFDLGATHVGAVATAGRPPALRTAELPRSLL